MTLIPSLAFTELRVVFLEHLQRVWYASRERLPFVTSVSIPLRAHRGGVEVDAWPWIRRSGFETRHTIITYRSPVGKEVKDVRTSRCLCRGRLGTLKAPSCPWLWVPVNRSKFGSLTTVPSPYSWNIAEYDIKRKRRRSDPVLWQNPLYQQKIRKPKDNTHKRHQKLRLHNDCGPIKPQSTIPLRNCLCSMANCWDNFSQGCHVFSRLFT